MNKGLEIRDKKLKRKLQKRNEIKEAQKGLVRFIDVKWEVIERVNGKYVHTGQKNGSGLQIENRVYLTDGHYKMLNSKSMKITKIYDEVPTWATEDLIEMWNEKRV